MNDNVENLINSLRNESEAVITVQVVKDGLCRTDYKIPEGAGTTADDLAFMGALLVKAVTDTVNMIRNDVIEQGKVTSDQFDSVMAKYLKGDSEPIDPLSR